ncbi:unnamed protein product [Prorocentrum cordatum]|uniref:Uncharacterized protein n=1 Tax=Prorocentrum cordatum TaxID=2364126 RepID=A0ABN9US63_9DINO|nr:unnamed protein product [Polarella glacialis]
MASQEPESLPDSNDQGPDETVPSSPVETQTLGVEADSEQPAEPVALMPPCEGNGGTGPEDDSSDTQPATQTEIDATMAEASMDQAFTSQVLEDPYADVVEVSSDDGEEQDYLHQLKMKIEEQEVEDADGLLDACAEDSEDVDVDFAKRVTEASMKIYAMKETGVEASTAVPSTAASSWVGSDGDVGRARDLEAMLEDEANSLMSAGRDLPASMDKLMADAHKATSNDNLLSDMDVLNLNEPRAKFFKQMMAQDWKFDARGAAGNPAGGQWDRFINGKSEESIEAKQNYKALGRNPDAQRDFRARWMKKQFTEWKQEKVKMERLSRRTFSDERYYVLNRIITEEGGGKRGEQNAINYTLKCVAMGPPFYKWCTWRKDWLYLYRIDGIEESYEERWQLTKTAYSSGSTDIKNKDSWLSIGTRAAMLQNEAAPAPPAPPAEAQVEPEEKPEVTAEEKAEETAEPKAEDETQPEPPTEPEGRRRRRKGPEQPAAEPPTPEEQPKKRKANSLISDAKAAKLAYSMAITAADALISDVKGTDESWTVFDTPGHIGKVLKARENLDKELKSNVNFSKFISGDVAEMLQKIKAKKNEDAISQFERWLQDFSEKVNPGSNKLVKATRMIVSMHDAWVTESAKLANKSDGQKRMRSSSAA